MRIAVMKYVLLLAVLGCARERPAVPDSGKAQASPTRASATNDSSPGARVAGGLTPDGRRTLLFVGTSLTAGLGLDPDSAYPQLVQRKIDQAGLRYEVINAGISGETSSALVRRLDWLLRQPIDVVVIETGANDGLRGIPVATMKENIQAIIDRIRAVQPGARIALVQMEAMPNLGRAYTSGFHDVFPELAKRNNVALLPFLLENVAGVRALNQGDGIHPNEEGERIVAENVWKALRPLLQ
jgi:acyl-CoA thioesterase I